MKTSFPKIETKSDLKDGLTRVYDAKEWYCAKAASVIMWAKEYGNFTERSDQIACNFKLFVLQLLMEILYAQVQHIIAMNQGIQMSNAA